MTLSVDIHRPAGLPEGEALQPSAREKLPEGAVEAAVPAVPEQVRDAKDRAVDDGAEAATCGRNAEFRRVKSFALDRGLDGARQASPRPAAVWPVTRQHGKPSPRRTVWTRSKTSAIEPKPWPSTRARRKTPS